MDAEQKLVKLIKTPVKIKKIKIGKFQINFVVAGKGQPLVLIHGANIGWGQWYPNIAELAKHYKIYALDLPGSGNSTRIDYLQYKGHLIDDFVEVVEKFISQNKLKNVNLIGHSIGAVVAVKVAARKKIQVGKIVLLNPLGFSDYIPAKQKLITVTFLAKLLSKTAMKPTHKNMDIFLRSVFSKPDKLVAELVDYYHESITRGPISHPFIFMNSLTKGLKMSEDLLFLDELGELNMPVFVILGVNDPLLSIKKVTDAFNLFPKLQVKKLTNAGHVPSIEKSDEFNKLVINFLR